MPAGRASVLHSTGGPSSRFRVQGRPLVRRHQTLRSFASDPRGFTLIEMLIVAAIVGLLASVAVAAHAYGRIRGGEVAAVAALGAINQAQFAYRETCGN